MPASSLDHSLALPYIGPLLEAIPAALVRLAPVRFWAVLDRRAGGIERIAASEPAPALNSQLVDEVLSAGRATVVGDASGRQDRGSLLIVPLACNGAARLCFYAELATVLAPGLLEHWEGLTRGCGEIAGAAIEAISGLRGLLEDASEGIVVADERGNYIDVNRAACEIVGYPREQMLRFNYRDLLAPKEAENTPIQYERLFAGQTVRIERQLQRLDGRSVITELSGKLASDGRFVALARDITERRLAERALRESEERYRALTEAAFEAIGIHDGEVWLEANAALAATFGRSPEQLIGASVHEVVPPEEWQRVLDLSREKGGRFEFSTQHADGEMVHYEVCAKSVPYHGRKVMLAAGRDISARKRAEAELERVAAERRRLTSTVIAAQEQERLTLSRELHDHVGQVLAVLKMDAAWLAQQAERPDEVRAVAARLDAKVDEMLQVVRDLSYKLRPAVLDDLGLACALETLVSEIATHSPITFDVTMSGPDRLPTEIATALYRIAQESLANVLRHSQARHCDVRIRAEPDEIELMVEHDGAVIEPSLFDNSAAVGITGMRERSALLGGQFQIVPREGGGTVLQVQIPLGERS